MDHLYLVNNNILPEMARILERFEIVSEPPSPEFECSVCSDTGRVFEKVEYRGRWIDNVKRCECVRRRIRTKLLDRIPVEYKDVSLETLQPRPDLHRRQPEFVELLKANPQSKFVISGDFGTGKTHFFYSLYREAVLADRKVYAGTLRELITEYQKAIELSQNGERYFVPITADELRQQATPYSLFLDDIDKARASEYVAEQLFDLIDSAYLNGHQIVVTTNLNLDNLVNHFSKADDFGRYGGAIVRRLLDKAHEIEMW